MRRCPYPHTHTRHKYYEITHITLSLYKRYTISIEYILLEAIKREQRKRPIRQETMALSLAGKRCIITGAASGLGKATAARFAREGAQVVILDLPTSEGTSVADELGDNVVFHPTDVTSEEDVNGALDLCESTFGAPCNVAVNCAGIGVAAKIIGKKGAHPLDMFNKCLQVNTVGTFNVLRLAAERMSKTEGDGNDLTRGVIVNTASIAAYDGQIGQIAYAASKGAIVGMTLPAARDLASLNIRVNTVAPGLFLTPLLEALPEKVQTQLGATVPFPNRLGVPDDYAKMVQNIVENDYINGEVFRIDGGLRMQP